MGHLARASNDPLSDVMSTRMSDGKGDVYASRQERPENTDGK